MNFNPNYTYIVDARYQTAVNNFSWSEAVEDPTQPSLKEIVEDVALKIITANDMKAGYSEKAKRELSLVEVWYIRCQNEDKEDNNLAILNGIENATPAEKVFLARTFAQLKVAFENVSNKEDLKAATLLFGIKKVNSFYWELKRSVGSVPQVQNSSSSCHIEGNFKDGKLNGLGRIKFPSGEIQEGDFKDGKLFGLGKLIFPDGEVWEGEFLGDKLHGLCKKTFSNGNIWEGKFKNGDLIQPPSQKPSPQEEMKTLLAQLVEFRSQHSDEVIAQLPEATREQFRKMDVQIAETKAKLQSLQEAAV
jgi:hypothetical protein